MEINEASKKFVNEFLNTKGVYGIDYYKCKCCNNWNIRVDMDTNDTELMKKIPDTYEGFHVEKNLSNPSVAQELKDNKPKANHIAKEFVDKYLNAQRMIYGAAANQADNTIDVLMDTTNKNIMALVPDSFKGVKINKIQSEPIKAQTETKITRVKITPKGQYVITKAPITGGYIPEDIFVLLLLKDGKSYDLDYLKTSKRKLANFDGLIMYMFAKGLISINDATSPNAEDYSNARGGRGGGGRRGGFARRPSPRGSFRGGSPKQQLNYVRRNYNRFGYGYPYNVAIVPTVAYIYDEAPERTPKLIKITKKGFMYLRKNIKDANSYFLSAIANGADYDDVTLRNKLGLNDWNEVVSELYINGLIQISK
jgi:hypothetical protein